ncbi:unnamed protein product [Discosporangium mesarthrocarpum]
MALRDREVGLVTLFSQCFRDFLSMVHTGVPLWLSTEESLDLPMVLAGLGRGGCDAPVPPTPPDELACLYMAHTMINAVSVYVRASVATAMGSGGAVGPRGRDATGAGGSSKKCLEGILWQYLEVAANCIDHYLCVVHAGLVAVYLADCFTGVRCGSDVGGGSGGDNSNSKGEREGRAGEGGFHLARARAEKVASSMLQGSWSGGIASIRDRLAGLGFRDAAVVKLLEDLRSPEREVGRGAPPTWQALACMSSTSMASTAATRSAAPLPCFMEPPGMGKYPNMGAGYTGNVSGWWKCRRWQRWQWRRQGRD